MTEPRFVEIVFFVALKWNKSSIPVKAWIFLHIISYQYLNDLHHRHASKSFDDNGFGR